MAAVGGKQNKKSQRGRTGLEVLKNKLIEAAGLVAQVFNNIDCPLQDYQGDRVVAQETNRI